MTTPNWKNQTIWTGDNLDIMRGMNSDSVDLIYIDPPFNTGRDFAAPIGSKAAGAAFKDMWNLSDIDLAWLAVMGIKDPDLVAVFRAIGIRCGKNMMSYAAYMYQRIEQMHRILKPTGTFYLHCDPTADDVLRGICDMVFGRKNFRNQIIWSYRGWGAPNTNFFRKHDVILRYSNGDTVIWNQLYEPLAPSTLKQHGDGKRKEAVGLDGVRRKVKSTEKTSGAPMRSVWEISALHPRAKERRGYPTQKPRELMNRIIEASSNPGDTVADFFCGCATTLVEAEALQRQWVGVDISPKAAEEVKDRLEEEMGLLVQPIHRTDIPKRTDLGVIPKYNCTANKQQLYGEQEGECPACQTHFQMRNLTVDHLVPKSKGGTDHISNLQLLCGQCNSVKGNRSYEWLIAELTRRGRRRT